jgi:hypothetical protein
MAFVLTGAAKASQCSLVVAAGQRGIEGRPRLRVRCDHCGADRWDKPAGW